MTNNQYGTFPTPSSRPPEPPYRASTAETSRMPIPAGNSQSDEGHVYQSPDLSGLDRAGTAPIPDATADGATAEMPRASYESPTADGAAATGQARRPADGTFEARAVRASEPARKQGGAGKTFLFGFLGALVACVLAFGGFALWNGSNSAGATGQAPGSTTTLGASTSSVIEAGENETLAEVVAAKALPSVVAVYNYQQATTSSYFGYGYGTGNSGTDTLSQAGMGSGVAISDDGYILTNYHVVEDAAKITVKVGDEERDATYVGGDESSDVAVIKVDDVEGVVAADIGDSDDLVIGEWVMTIGAPLGLEQSVATGVVSATNRSNVMSDSSSNGYTAYGAGSQDYVYYPNMIQTDAVINPGNSGGALVDSDGKLIGINTMISSYSGDYAGVGFAIPVNYAMGLAEQIIEGGTPTHAMLGVSISSVNATIAQRYNLSTDSGAYVSAISEDTGAANSDLQVGDIITAIDGKKITSTTDVTLDVREHNPGDTVTVTVNRNGQTLDIPVVLSSDESISSQGSGSGSGQNGSGNGSGNGNGYGYGQGYSIEDILRMLGM